MSKIECRLCGATLSNCCGWLARVNEKGVPGIWECRPGCLANKLTQEEAVIGAITGEAIDSAMLAAAPTERVSEEGRDAQRYRWLRDFGLTEDLWNFYGEHLDAAIDAALAAERKEPK